MRDVEGARLRERPAKGGRQRALAAGLVALALAATPLAATTAAADTPPSATLTTFTANYDSAANPAPAGAFSVPLAGIPAETFHPASQASPPNIEAISLAHINLANTSLGHISLGHIGLDSISAGTITIAQNALKGMLLADIPITYTRPGCIVSPTTPCTGWSGLLFGTSLAGQGVQTVTLFQVLADPVAAPRFDGIPLANIDFSRTALGALPYSALVLADVPLNLLKLNGPGAATTTALQQWCTLLAAPPPGGPGIDCPTQLQITNASDPAATTPVTLVTLALAGVPFSELPLNEIAFTVQDQNGQPLISLPASTFLGGLPVDSLQLQSASLAHISLGHIGIGGTALANTALGALSLGHIDLSDISAVGTSLGHISLAHIDLSASSLGHISLAHIGLPTPSSAFSTSLAHISLGHIDMSASSLGHISLAHIGLPTSTGAFATSLGHISLAHIDLSASSLGHISLAHIDLSNPNAASLATVSLGHIDLASSNVGGLTLDKLGLATSALGNTPLSDINFAGDLSTTLGTIAVTPPALGTCTSPATSCTLATAATLTGHLSDLAGAAQLSTTTLAQLLAATSSTSIAQGVTLQQLVAGTDATSLSPLILSDVLLHLTGGDPTNALQTTLVELLAAINDVPTLNGFTLADVLTHLNTTTAADTLAVIQATVDDLYGAITDPGTAAALTLADVLTHVSGDSNATDALNATLAGLIGALTDAAAENGLTLADLLAHLTDPATQTAADGVSLAQLLASINDAASKDGLLLGDLLKALNDQGLTLADLLVGILGGGDPSSLPWETLNLQSAALQPFATPSSATIVYTGHISVGGTIPAPGATVLFDLTLPPGFTLKAGGTQFTPQGGASSPLPDPVAEPSPNQSTYTLTLGPLPAGEYDVQVPAWAGLNEGTFTATAEAHLQGDAAGTPLAAATGVADAATSGNAASPAAMTAGTLYLGHLSPQRKVAYFSISVPAGQKLSLLLGNLPADYDLVLYDQPDPTGANHLRGAPLRSIIPVNDSEASLTPLSDTKPPDTLQDVPLLPGQRVYAVSANRGNVDERIDTGRLAPGTYLVQVSSYNNQSSAQPFSLRARFLSDPDGSCPGTPLTFLFPTATFPLTPVFPAPTGAVDTVILLNGNRLAQTYGSSGPNSAADAATALAAFQTAYGKAVVLRLDQVPAIVNAYAAWDANPCSVDLANAIVRLIGQQLDAARQTYPSLRFVTIVGSDTQLPMARVRDATTVANEQGFANELPSVEDSLTASLSGGYVLTDDAYATSNPIGAGDRDLFVPQLAVGRLVETPDQMAQMLNLYVASHGSLPSSNGLATGYDFLVSGTQAVVNGLNQVPRTVTVLNPNNSSSQPWSRTDLANALLASPTPGAPSNPSSTTGVGHAVPNIASINAHFDQANLLPGNGNRADLFTTQDVAGAGNNVLLGSLLFSMGCHSGFHVSDDLAAALGSTAALRDWAETFSAQGALYVANTGYGYGDDAAIALSAKLMSLFAGRLDHTLTIGEALATAKQLYADGLAVVSPYDEKALMEATFYGLPMFQLQSPGATDTPLPSPTASIADPQFAGLRSANYSRSLTDAGLSGAGPNQLQLVSPSGDLTSGHYAVAGDAQETQDRPTQPKVQIDVSPNPSRDSALNGLVAKGALITSLSSVDKSGFLPDYERPTVDLSANEAAQIFGNAPFPAGLQAIDTSAGKSFPSQHLVIVPGQFRATPGLSTPGRGTERLFTQFGAHVYYGSPSDANNVPPTILSSSADVSDGSAVFTAHVDDLASPNRAANVGRVLVLYSVSTSPGQWTALDLQRLGAPSLGTWVAGVSVPAGAQVDYYLQAVDASGNVGISASTGAFFNAVNNRQTGNLSFTVSGPQGLHGWWRGAVTVQITAPGTLALFGIEYSVDGGPFVPYGGSVSVSGDGVHTLVARQPAIGGADSVKLILIDSAAPIPGMATIPVPNANGWITSLPSGHAEVDFTPVDPGQFGSGVDTITYSATGVTPIPTTTVNEPPVGSPPADLLLTKDGVTNLSESATDRAGNTSPAFTEAVQIDTTPPTVTPSTDTPLNAAGWHNQATKVTISAVDNPPAAQPCPSGVQCVSGVAGITYSIDGVFTTVPGVSTVTFPVSEGRHLVGYTVSDIAGNASSGTRQVNVDLTTPVSALPALTPVPNGPGWVRANSTITFSATDPDGPGTATGSASGVDHLTVSATTVVGTGPPAVTRPSTPSANPTIIPWTTEGVTTFTYFATDVAGNVEASHTFVVKLDKTPPAIAINLPATRTTASTGHPVPPINGPVSSPNPLQGTLPVYVLHEAVQGTWSCNDTAGGESGILPTTGGCQAVNSAQTLEGTIATGGLIANGTVTLDTSTVGIKTVTVSTQDVAGNPASLQYFYRVVYNICTSQSGVNFWVQLCDASKQQQKFSFATSAVPKLVLYSNGGSTKVNQNPGFGQNWKCLVSPGGSGCPTTGTGFQTFQYQQLPSGTHKIAFQVSVDPVLTPTWAGPPKALPYPAAELYAVSYKM